ncbi:MAG: 4-hydroxy-2-oxovalerate aldolase [Methanoregula sp.]|jgi:4-hydroxy-2-oxovalerate aldolase|uniref:4-hydroxy-2-oxovalerate aldolase n=1 Tax=Methanoregula sp. TaxID=2052170 RepID=UPI003D108278
MTTEFNIMDTTLRDGSYAVDFSFTSSDTAIICRELEDCGLNYIEVGHGVGLSASGKGHGRSAETDEQYMIAAEQALRRARYGMFCIPGIAELDDIDLAARHNMGFIRIGTNVTEIPGSEPFIRRAKDCGMFVTANFMKSYALPPEAFAKKVLLSENYGADVVYLVDSAGGFFPGDIHRYYNAIREVSDIPLGFHGHDNLGMAVSNSLEAVNTGFGFVDSSLQGLGRSSGNAATEILVAALLKQGFDLNIDFLKLLDIGQKYVQPLITTKGRAPLDIVAGFADFHSSYMHFIQEYSAKYRANPALLIIGMCKLDKVDLDERKLEELAHSVRNTEDIFLGKYNFNKYIGHEQEALHGKDR